MNQQNIQNAFQMLASLEMEMSQMRQKIATINNLLQVSQVQQQSPQTFQQQQPMQAGSVQGSTKVELALWDKPVEQGKTPMITGNVKFNDVTYNLALFQSKPNDSSMVFNGYVLPQNDDRETPLSEKKVGGAFIYNNQDGLSMSLAIDESPLLNQTQARVPLVFNSNKQPGDKQPTLRGQQQIPAIVVKPVDQVLQAQGIQLPNMPQQQAPQPQPSQPADPMQGIFTNWASGQQQPQQQPSHNDLNQLLGQGQQPQQGNGGGQPPTQGGGILGSLLS